MLKGRGVFAVIVLLTAGVWLWLYSEGFLHDLDKRLQDKMLMPRRAAGEIVIVTIDNQSIQALGVWPFPRSLHAELIEKIAADQPTVIGYDVTFAEASTATEDQALAEALRRSGEVVLASEAVLEVERDGLPLAVSMLEPMPSLMAVARATGPTTLVPDHDGVIRQVPASYLKTATQVAPSFARVLAEADGVTRVDDAQGLFRVPYVGGPETFAMVSFADVMADKVPSGTFTNKTVLVGATAPDLHDEYLTPFGAGRATSGVEIQANIIQALREGRALRALSFLQVASIFAVITVLGLVVGWGLRLRYVGPVALVVAVGYLLLAVALAGQELLLPIVSPLVLIGLIFSLDVLYRYRDEYSRRQFIQDAFGRYVAPTVVEKLANGEAELKLGGVKAELTILFSDIRGFTTLSERLSPEDLVHFLNEYLTGMTDITLEHEGTVDKYIGDAVMAFWGAPLPQTDHAVRAATTAVAMKQRLNELNALWQKSGQPTIDIGVGLNTGRVIVGNMGSERRFDYTVIGDDVNLASRLESLTKFYGVGILISEATRKQLGDNFLVRPLDKVAVKGKKDAVKIFEILCHTADATDKQRKFVADFEKALASYYARDWQAAQTAFAKFVDDKTSQMLLERARHYAAEDPGEGWDGTYIAKEK